MYLQRHIRQQGSLWCLLMFAIICIKFPDTDSQKSDHSKVQHKFHWRLLVTYVYKIINTRLDKPRGANYYGTGYFECIRKS